MACCAFAAFLIGQFLLLGGRFRGLFGPKSTPLRTSAAEWRPGLSAASESRSVPGRVRRRIGFLLAGLGIAGMAGAAVAATNDHRVELGDTGIYVSVCGDPGTSFSLTNLFGSI